MSFFKGVFKGCLGVLAIMLAISFVFPAMCGHEDNETEDGSGYYSTSKTIKDTYGAWTSNGSELALISRTLLKNKIRGCGEFHYKRKLDSDIEYLVGCYDGNGNWDYYMVFTSSEDVIGPLANPVINEAGDREVIDSAY